MMKIKLVFIVFIFFPLSATMYAAETSPPPVPVRTETAQKIFVVPVSGEVGPAMAAFIERALLEGRKYSDSLFVLELDTFGGRVDSAFQIVDALLGIPRERTVAFVIKKAISAGALIALSCGSLAMQPATTIGDCAPIIYSNEGPEMLGEKFQSPIRAKFRTLAKRNGYPQVLAESMVSPDMEVYRLEMKDGTVQYVEAAAYDDFTDREAAKVRSKKTVVAQGRLLTIDDREAVEFGFSGMSVGSVPELLDKKGIRNYQIIRIAENWSELTARFVTAIAPILLLIGFAGLYIETQTPGFGFPGILGILCLALVFLSQYMAGLADYTELLILVLGILLLGIEMFVIPGFGISGVTGIALIAAGMILSFQNFIVPDPEIPWEIELLEKNILTVAGSFFGAFLLIFLFFRYGFPGFSRMIPGPYLSATLAGSRSDMKVSVSAGDLCTVVKPLRPSGTVRIGDELFDVISDGDFITKGQTVIVTEICGNRIMVTRNILNGQ